MGIVVFDADVVIGYLERTDPHHPDAAKRMRLALETGTRRLISAVNYTEVLIRPLQVAGEQGAATVDAMLTRLGIVIVQVDMALARLAASVRTRTGLRLPDAYAVATAIHAEKGGREDVRLESFDEKVVKAYAGLHGGAGESL